MDELLSKVKVALRTTVDDVDLDNEINDLIIAARTDLNILGLVETTWAAKLENKSLVEMAIILYVKSHWGYDNPDADRQLSLYNDLKAELSVHSRFDAEVADEI